MLTAAEKLTEVTKVARSVGHFVHLRRTSSGYTLTVENRKGEAFYHTHSPLGAADAINTAWRHFCGY